MQNLASGPLAEVESHPSSLLTSSAAAEELSSRPGTSLRAYQEEGGAAQWYWDSWPGEGVEGAHLSTAAAEGAQMAPACPVGVEAVVAASHHP